MSIPTQTGTDRPAWLQRFVDKFTEEARPDGDLISHDWIKWALDVPAPKSLDDAERIQFLLLSRFDAAREWLLIERKIALRNVRGTGYQIVPPSQQAEYAAEVGMRLVSKGLEKADEYLTHTRMDALTDGEKKRHTDTQIRMCGLKDLMRRERRNVFLMFAPKKKEPA